LVKRELILKILKKRPTKVKLGPVKRSFKVKRIKNLRLIMKPVNAIVTHFLPKTDPVERISIVARGMSLGHTLIPPAADRTHETKSRMLEQITAILGGRAAEEVIFKEMTSGAANDIDKATGLARAMVVQFGMSDLGPLNLGPQYETDELDRAQWYEPANISPAMQEKVDLEIKKMVDSCYYQAVEIIKTEKVKLDSVAEALLKKGVL